MSARKILIISCLFPLVAFSATVVKSTPKPSLTSTFTQPTLADQLGWIKKADTPCGGFYLEQPFVYPVSVEKNKAYVEITSNQSMFAQNGTSILEGKVSITRFGQQIKANKAYVYRDPVTGKLSNMDLIGNVILREPNTLVVGTRGTYSFQSKVKTLEDLLYRTSMTSTREVIGAKNVSDVEIENERTITADMTAWGKAHDFTQAEPRIYELTKASFTTCSPVSPAWHVKTSHLVLNKNIGRGYATNLRLYVKDVPVFYFPYINFSIDRQRKSGFLWPTFGWKFIQLRGTSRQVPFYYLYTPFYVNLAPNYDTTVTPGVLTNRGVQLSDKFRYLTPTSAGTIDISALPGDKMFADFQTAIKSDPQYYASTDSTTQAEYNRLINTSNTRKSFAWNNHSRFNDHWSSDIKFNYVGDDYYMRDLSGLGGATQNQLLQQGDIAYEGRNWNFTGRVQTYQTLHPVDEPPVVNQYRRYPQLILNGSYPDQPLGLEYFIGNEATHFDIRNTPGAITNQPIGNRINVQPGVSLPLFWPFFYINPRAQMAYTVYDLYQTTPTGTPTNIHRSVPIFDIATGSSFVRDMGLFGNAYTQTLEPQVYYTYIPYKNQDSIPVFDTTVNTLTYDQLFNYNRFSGIDRIGDANQLGAGVTTRMIESESGIEKVRLGVGELIYFANRRVTFCNTTACTDNPFNPNNHRRLSPISGLLNYNVNQNWGIASNAIWNPISKQLDNSTVGFHYMTDNLHILNLRYEFIRNGDIQSGINVNTSENNMKLTDFSVSWPLYVEGLSGVGRWTENWNQLHLQNLLYGVQYDTCCWAVRAVGGNAYIGFDATNNNKPMYSKEYYIQFALKGLGNIGSGSPTELLKDITGYNTKFGQEF